MLNFNSYVHLRYILLINIVAALVPATEIRGRANDPLLHASWWRMDQHFAVLVVALAAIVGSAIVFVTTRYDFRKWWVFVGCGVLAGNFPATFYLAAAPDSTYLPLADMYVSGTLSGAIAGVVMNLLLRQRKPSP
jgi:Na+-transporting NADH:ubiquinone oxidoreductase subunit NqrE